MKTQINLLIKLQKAITETAALNLRQEEIPEQLKTLDYKLEEFENIVKESEKSLNDKNKEYRSLESETKTISSQIKKGNEKLNLAKTNKEYNSSLKEIDALKEKNSAIEDNMLETLEEIDTYQEFAEQKRREYNQFLEKTKKEKESAQKELESNQKELEKLQILQNQISAEIDPDLMKLFLEKKQGIKNNLFIVPVEESICRGCNMNIPPQLYNEAHNPNKLLQCPHCERFIYGRRP